MQFDSLEFLLFLPITFVTYWAIPNVGGRNLLLVVASYLFYANTDVHFTLLLAAVTTVAYLAGKYILNGGRHKKNVLAATVVLGIAVLFVFKYFNFFVDSFIPILKGCGLKADGITASLLLPAGLSFYVFMAISYVIDCNRGKIEGHPNALTFFAYVSFFPHLLAGPIDRARLMLPQMSVMRKFTFEMGSDGLKQILTGLFKKVVIADSCDSMVSAIWADISEQSSLTLIIGAMLYSVQIYCDFSGYSDMAIGTGKLFGLRMMRNFDYPYFSRNVTEFWRKWHISLTSWFTEYLYIPLGGNRKCRVCTVVNTLIVFTLCGLWHGANWTFVAWGFLCGAMFIPILLQNNPRKYKGEAITLDVQTLWRMILTFALITFSWIFFRADSVTQAFDYISAIFTNGGLAIDVELKKSALLCIVIVTILEWRQRNSEYMLERMTNLKRPIRWLIYFAMIFLIFKLQQTGEIFIYSNF